MTWGLYLIFCVLSLTSTILLGLWLRERAACDRLELLARRHIEHMTAPLGTFAPQVIEGGMKELAKGCGSDASQQSMTLNVKGRPKLAVVDKGRRSH
ncbi:MAG TPA: hypothetical protein VMB05_18410 [Solirubrobacteraceae bacterium]|nr:hypothetical protein [Solirubrobacteraceae bacterium]